MSEKLLVNPIDCDGHGACAELLPELVTMDEWGYPVIAPRPVPEGLERHARKAVSACPTLALRLVRELFLLISNGPWLLLLRDLVSGRPQGNLFRPVCGPLTLLVLVGCRGGPTGCGSGTKGADGAAIAAPLAPTVLPSVGRGWLCLSPRPRPATTPKAPTVLPWRANGVR